jgi:glycosyltransferase involved in cell wall biosynthesis
MPTAPSDQRIRVLFINSAVDIGADTAMHLLLLRHLPRDRFELHAAGQPGFPAPAFDELRTIPDVALRPTYFGPSFWQQSRVQKLAGATNLVPMAASLLGLAAYIRRQRIQIIHSTDRPRDSLACVALAALTGAKSVVHAHVNFGDWMGRGVRWAFGRADALVGVSRFSAGTFVSAGYPPEHVCAVLNAIETSRWDPTLDPSIGRASLGVPSDAPLILSVARLFRPKGHHELVQALARVKGEFPDVRLAIVGADYPVGNGETRWLQDRARELGVAENVIFTGQRSDIPYLMAACDVFSLPSFLEPFGLVFAEAMAMKRPVVALTNGGTPEVVEHEKSGLLSASGDIDALAANLLRLLRDPGLRQRLGEHGRRRVEAHFTPPRMAADIADLYARLLA